MDCNEAIEIEAICIENAGDLVSARREFEPLRHVFEAHIDDLNAGTAICGTCRIERCPKI